VKLIDWVFRRDEIGPYHDYTRWTLLKVPRFLGGQRLYLHQFHRADTLAHHDHPCDVTSFVFRGRYLEHSIHPERGHIMTMHVAPGIRHFLAEHTHRIEIPRHLAGKVWSLCWFSRKRRDWGFWLAESSVTADGNIIEWRAGPEHLETGLDTPKKRWFGAKRYFKEWWTLRRRQHFAAAKVLEAAKKNAARKTD